MGGIALPPGCPFTPRPESFHVLNQSIEAVAASIPILADHPCHATVTPCHAVAKVLCPVGRNRIEEKIVGIIMINCPATGHGVSTGIEVVATDQIPIVTATMVCPACGRVHEWTKKDAWLANGGEQYRGEPYRKLA
jgi:hypothetical protein